MFSLKQGAGCPVPLGRQRLAYTACTMIDASPTIAAVTPPALLGESPLWSPDEHALYYCDIAGHTLHRLDPATGHIHHWRFDTEPACCVLAQQGGLLVACRDGLWHLNTATDQRRHLVPAPYNTAVERFNDGRCDAQGRFWVGTLFEPRQPANAALYCFEQGQLRRVRGDITVSNGLAFSPDGATMYWADTTAHAVYALPYAATTGHLGQRRVFKSFAQRHPDQPLAQPLAQQRDQRDHYGGRPDGAVVDAEGCYWLALYEGARVLRLSPAGEVLHEVRLPVQCPTMPCLGGSDLRTLYITTARHRRPPDELQHQPNAGCVFALRVDVPGNPPACANLAPLLG